MGKRGVFIGVGIDTYDVGLRRLDHAVADVSAVAECLSTSYEGEPLLNGTTDDVTRHLKSFEGKADGRALVLLWSGHGSNDAGLRLATRNDVDDLAAAEVIRRCVRSRANQLLFIIDTCQAEAVLHAAHQAAEWITNLEAPHEHVWFGFLVSCSTADYGARDGAFGALLVKLLKHGPDSPDQKRRWSRHNRFILGEDLGQALLEEWRGEQRPDFLRRGRGWYMLPNPLWTEDAPEEVVEHLLLAARGGASEDRRSWFTGRAAEVDQVVSWVVAAEPGVRVVTGSAGTGKSAIVGRVVSMSNAEERAGLRWTHADPGRGSVTAHVHARGLTADLVADVLDGQLVRAGLLPPEPAGRRNAAELVGAVQRAVTESSTVPVIVIDGLDEARGDSLAIASDVISRLAPFASVVVSTRPLTVIGGDGPRDVLSATEVLDLDLPRHQESGRAAINDYVRHRLSDVDVTMDAEEVARHLESSSVTKRPFLLARVITDQLRATPVDTSRPDWRQRVAGSIEEAFDHDLGRAEPPPPDSTSGLTPQQLARTMLTALTWGMGAGFPEAEWLAVASALADTPLDRDHVSWAVDQLGRYVVQDGAGGVAVYRLAHQSLSDHLRPARDSTADPGALRVLGALLARYEQLLADGQKSWEPAYLRDYAWLHAAKAGNDGLVALRELATRTTGLRADVADASMYLSNDARTRGRHTEAIAPIEDAVLLYTALAEDDPVYTSDLIRAQMQLGICYDEVGRTSDAIAPTEQASALVRELAAHHPVFVPGFAGTLINLGNWYSGVGRQADAIAATEEAVSLVRAAMTTSPDLWPTLATALSNLGVMYGDVGRYADALAPAEEAVALYRSTGKPVRAADFAGLLTNLSNLYNHLGRHAEAIECIENSVVLARLAAAGNPEELPRLVRALINLGSSYDKVGRWAEALAPAEEAVANARVLAEHNPGCAGDLAKALIHLGMRYRAVGRDSDAIAPAEEAVALRRALVVRHPAHRTDLASALNGLCSSYCSVGRHAEALAPIEEAITLLREAAATNPAHIADLGGALHNLVNVRHRLGRGSETLELAAEAVDLFRAAVAVNPMHVPALASALSNLGVNCKNNAHTTAAIAALEEAVALYRDAATGNPAHRPGLAGMLINLARCHGEVERHTEAIACAEEAVTLLREAAATSSAHLPDLALALHSVGVWKSRTNHHAEAIATTREAVELRRPLATHNPAHVPDLAKALKNIGSWHVELAQLAEAVEPLEESIELLTTAAAGNPTLLPELASALTDLTRLLEDSDDERVEAAWQHALDAVPTGDATRLLVSRSDAAERGDPRTAAWLQVAERDGDRRVVAAARDRARGHWRASSDAWATAWAVTTNTDTLPSWLTVDEDELALAKEWISAGSVEGQREVLRAHPELLDASFDLAVREALAGESREVAKAYSAHRDEARSAGVDASYRKLVRVSLAADFLWADPATRRLLLTERRAELFDEEFVEPLKRMATEDDLDQNVGNRARIALALIDFAQAGHDEQLTATLDALEQRDRLAALLDETARRPDAPALAHIAMVAFLTSEENVEAMNALFYFEVASAIDGDDDCGGHLRDACELAPDERTAWITRLAELGAVHPRVLPLIKMLAVPDPAP
ncbi:tetratricopeptide repeat protein [Lentzea tibetensis]|uniref:Tetratricopeptide repeat protein n=1 Tax=Lentzea tibetensis TaxID=2591470 RepID=A0A563ETB8_9PSEU|nr:tetratricopeptide repeat protein [Lentzea tibetensis]TWP50916.1 tetratricopeptide repeat protein [Lentzea tibetensis]